MHKHSTVILLGLLVVFLSSYILWNNKVEQKRFAQLEQMVQKSKQTKEVVQNPDEDYTNGADGGSISFYPNEYVLIPELKIGFRKVPGLTIKYTIENGSVIRFNSEELLAASKHIGMSYCASKWLPTIQIQAASTLGKGEFEGYVEKKLDDGRYADIHGPNAPCFDENASQADKDLAMNQLNVLFNEKFLSTMQSY